VYANMFPDRVRAIVLDGVIDADAWAGAPDTAGVPMTARIRSGEGANRALREILDRCRNAGPDACEFARYGDPDVNYNKIIKTLKAGPYSDGYGWELSYADLTGYLLGDMYSTWAAYWVNWDLSYVYQLLFPEGDSSSAAKQKKAQQGLLGLRDKQRADRQRLDAFRKSARTAFPMGFPYYNDWEAYQAVLCTDGLNPSAAGDWPAFADANNKLAPNYGRLWTWASAPCASSTWTVQDEDAYRGPFGNTTVNPVLVVGSKWDPATNYDSAVKVSKELPGSRLLGSDNWGHTAYGTSECVTGNIDNYLLNRTLPLAGTTCTGSEQPFDEADDQAMARTATTRHLPPVMPLLPERTRR
jgi:hypothetical protein